MPIKFLPNYNHYPSIATNLIRIESVLSPDQIQSVLKHEGRFPGRERDEKEVKGYYAALAKVVQSATASPCNRKDDPNAPRSCYGKMVE
ncbi:MAG: hypothetical protein C5B45_00675 [Chlamydiae bacterium]|nr:MAG: hypothetical protein C5B45_00675 [Chlamydiota bacterium]